MKPITDEEDVTEDIVPVPAAAPEAEAEAEGSAKRSDHVTDAGPAGEPPAEAKAALLLLLLLFAVPARELHPKPVTSKPGAEAEAEAVINPAVPPPLEAARDSLLSLNLRSAVAAARLRPLALRLFISAALRGT